MAQNKRSWLLRERFNNRGCASIGHPGFYPKPVGNEKSCGLLSVAMVIVMNQRCNEIAALMFDLPVMFDFHGCRICVFVRSELHDRLLPTRAMTFIVLTVSLVCRFRQEGGRG